MHSEKDVKLSLRSTESMNYVNWYRSKY